MKERLVSEIMDLRKLAKQQSIELVDSKQLVSEAIGNITNRYGYSREEMKINFDRLIEESEQEAHRIYRIHEREYSKQVVSLYVTYLVKENGISDLNEVSNILGANASTLDKFFLSMAQGRKARAGSAFESFHKDLFRRLGYPFSEQQVINGKPDFLLPSADHYKINPPGCILFTVKRTIRERWRQIVTEGTKGLAYFLGTIDASKSKSELDEMLDNRIYLVCPHEIKQSTVEYREAQNVLSFQGFFRYHLDPAMSRWKDTGVIK